MLSNLLVFFDTNTALCLAFISALGVTVWLELNKGGPKVEVSDLVGMINRNDVLVVDTRQPKDYDIGHIDGAVNIPLAQVIENVSFIKNKNLTPVLVCENGFSSQSVGEKLRDSGVTSMRLAGGIAEWRAANIPLVKGLREHAKTKKHKGNSSTNKTNNKMSKNT